MKRSWIGFVLLLVLLAGGIAARFASSMVTTNSVGSISPICRLPISRTQTISTRYSAMVRT